jgi:hypothetical protein
MNVKNRNDNKTITVEPGQSIGHSNVSAARPPARKYPLWQTAEIRRNDPLPPKMQTQIATHPGWDNALTSLWALRSPVTIAKPPMFTALTLLREPAATRLFRFSRPHKTFHPGRHGARQITPRAKPGAQRNTHRQFRNRTRGEILHFSGRSRARATTALSKGDTAGP